MAKVLMMFSAHELELFTEFYVEELRPNGQWRLIPENSGPFTSSKTAATVARNYSIEHHVKTRVIGEQ